MLQIHVYSWISSGVHNQGMKRWLNVRCELVQFKFNPGSQLSRRSQNKHDLLDVRSGPTVTLRTWFAMLPISAEEHICTQGHQFQLMIIFCWLRTIDSALDWLDTDAQIETVNHIKIMVWYCTKNSTQVDLVFWYCHVINWF